VAISAREEIRIRENIRFIDVWVFGTVRRDVALARVDVDPFDFAPAFVPRPRDCGAASRT